MKLHTRKEIYTLIIWFITIIFLTCVGLGASKYNMSWLLETVDILKIVVSILALIYIIRIKKTK
jgi:hypothetical protein